MYLLLIIITILTLGVLYKLTYKEDFVVPTEAPKPPPTPYVPYVRLGDTRKRFFVTDNK